MSRIPGSTISSVDNARKACSEHAELARKTSSVHVVLRRLQQEAANPESPINRPGDARREELTSIMDGCKKVLIMMNKILEKIQYFN